MARGTGVVIDDQTPLNGATVDVGARIGWVLRMARTRHDRAPGLECLATALGTNITRLHRAETGTLRSGRIADGYEAALGLAPGALRAPIDITCRTFPSAPPDRDPGPPVTTVREMSTLTEQVLGSEVTGGQWLRWARALSQPGAIGLREVVARDLVRTLVAELSRSTSHAYPTRYEALALLRCSGYGHLVLEVAQEEAADPYVQVLNDLMSAVGEAPTPDAVAWCLDLLDSERPRLVVGAALAIEAMGDVAGAAFWSRLVEPLLDHVDRADAGTTAHEWISHLLRLVPRDVLAATGRRPRHPLADGAAIPDWSRSRLNRHWTECHERASEITTELGLPDQPMLARFLFEVAMGPHESRAVTSSMLLGALPDFPGAVGAHVGEIADSHPDPVVRERAGRRLAGALHGCRVPLITQWFHHGDAEQQERAYRIAGAAGLSIPATCLVTDPTDAKLYAAGMTSHPALTTLAEDPARPAEVRGAAQWWLRRGGRITD